MNVVIRYQRKDTLRHSTLTELLGAKRFGQCWGQQGSFARFCKGRFLLGIDRKSG